MNVSKCCRLFNFVKYLFISFFIAFIIFSPIKVKCVKANELVPELTIWEQLSSNINAPELGALGFVLACVPFMQKVDENIIQPSVDGFNNFLLDGIGFFTDNELIKGVIDGSTIKDNKLTFTLGADSISHMLNYISSKEGEEISTAPSYEFNGNDYIFNIGSIPSTPGSVLKICSFVASNDFQMVANLYDYSNNHLAYVNFMVSEGDFCTLSIKHSNTKPDFCLEVNGKQVRLWGFKYYGSCFVALPSHGVVSDSIEVFLPGSTFTYPDSIGKYGSIEDYEKANNYTGTPSVCVDWEHLLKGQDISKVNNIDDLIGVLEGVLSAPGGADVIGNSVSLEYDGVKVEDVPDISVDDTNEGIVNKVLDWVFELFKDLADLLEHLLSKLLQGLKDLLLSLFVPSDTYFSGQIDSLKNSLEPKIPVSQFTELFNEDYDGSPLEDIYIEIFGTRVCIVKVTLFDRFRDLFNWGVYALTFFLLSVYNYNNVYKLIRGSDYISATNTINNMSSKGGDE